MESAAVARVRIMAMLSTYFDLKTKLVAVILNLK